MTHDRFELEAKVERLSDRLSEVERRLAAVERLRPVPGETAPTSGPEAAPVGALPAVPGEPSTVEILPLIGRTLVVLAGAFALRAITEAGIVPQVVGTVLGIAYAILWIALADRAAARAHHRRAMFDGLASIIIGYPLLWEATVNFEFLTPLAGAVALSAITALALLVAARRKLNGLASVVTVGAIATALALAVATKMLVLFSWFLLLLASATLVLAYVREWRGLAWLAAFVVDAAVLLESVMVSLGRAEQVARIINPAALIGLQLTLVVVYFGSFFYRTLSTRQEATLAEIVQGVAALLVGVGGAVLVLRATDVSALPLGLVSLLLAVGCYAASFAFIDRRLERRSSFIFYTTAALVFTLVAFGSMLFGTALALALAGAALITAWIGSYRSRATLSLHAAGYAVAAAATSGLLKAAVDAFTGSTVPSTSWLRATPLLVLAVCAACVWMPVATHGKTWGRFSRAPKLVVAIVLLAGIGAVVVTIGAALLPKTDGGEIDHALIAALRTGVLAVSALLLAWVARATAAPEATWLVYTVLLAGGAKLLLEDMRAGRPATLFLSLALYGGALILAPRLARRKRESPAES